ncbi:MAG TPA: DUF1361 domain-containing protein [Flavisolibacter sp.]|nr:DUF1361 domain-containing protein [Flavisolibacter sp.]
MIKLLQTNCLLRQLYFNKPEMERLLMLSSLFSVGLTVARIFYTGEWLFAWLSWNLFLAIIPYVISRFAMRHPAWVESSFNFALLFICWLLFIPNSFYIITDLFHLEIRIRIPLWYDLALIFSFAWNGILFGVLSVRQMEKMVQLKLPLITELQFAVPVMLLNSFGIYIGRYLRYNTWDVIANPFQLTKDIVYLLLHPVQNRFDWGMIGCYAVFMTLIYLAVKRMSRAL